MNINKGGINEYDEMMSALYGKGYYLYALKNVDFDLKNWGTLTSQPSIGEPPILKLKALSSHLRYALLGVNNTLLSIIISDLLES